MRIFEVKQIKNGFMLYFATNKNAKEGTYRWEEEYYATLPKLLEAVKDKEFPATTKSSDQIPY